MTEMFVPYRNGGSFYGLSKPQYSSFTYYSLAASGSGAGGRGGRWDVANNFKVSFIPPSR
jgi:hypothetical protein